MNVIQRFQYRQRDYLKLTKQVSQKIEERKVTPYRKRLKDHNSKMKELIGKEFSKGHLGRYETSLRHTQSFLKWKFNLSDINVCDVNPAFVADYEFYLRTVRNCSNNSAKYIKNFQR